MNKLFFKRLLWGIGILAGIFLMITNNFKAGILIIILVIVLTFVDNLLLQEWRPHK